MLKSGEAGREVQGLAGRRSRELVEERGEKVRVVDDNGQLGEDVLVAEAALLQALSGELALLVGGDKLGRKAVGAEVETALGSCG